MAVQNLSEHVLLVTLPAEPRSGDEVESVLRSVGSRGDCDVIVDFSIVEIMSSATLCNLMILERLLSALGRRLVLCSVPSKIQGIFTRVGLHKLFQFTEDEISGLQSLDPDTRPDV